MADPTKNRAKPIFYTMLAEVIHFQSITILKIA